VTATLSVTLAVTSVAKGFAGPPVLRDVDLTCGPGAIAVLAGRRGAGKTCLLRCLSGTYRPDRGQVLLQRGGEVVDLARADSRTVAWVRAQHLAVFDSSLPAPPRQDAATAVARSGRTDRSSACDALDRLGAAHIAETPVGRLRSDQLRTVALAAALAKRSSLLLLDEPGDDRAVWEWIGERRAEGVAVVVTTSSEAAPSDAASIVGLIDQGVVRWQTLS
jgi:ABC-2 type transport system ATP-binding protein